MSKAVGICVSVLFSVVLLVCVFIASLEIALYIQPSYFQKEYEKYGVAEQIQIEMDELLYVTDEMMQYLEDKRQDLVISARIAGVEREFFSEREKAHMVDVKALFVAGRSIRTYGFMICMFLGILLILFQKDWINIVPQAFLATVAVVFIAAGILTVVISSNFTEAFTIFHQIFFENDLWILDPEVDLLVNIVPEPFFMDTAVRTGIIFALLVGCMSALGFFILHQGKKRKGKRSEP